LVDRFRKIEVDRMVEFLKGFAKFNLESTRLAFSGKEDECRRYLSGLVKRSEEEEPEIEDQFKGVDFGK
jgi:hypothetical protein